MSRKKNPKPTHRREFIAWLRAELEKRGDIIPEPFTYSAIKEALEARWLNSGKGDR